MGDYCDQQTKCITIKVPYPVQVPYCHSVERCYMVDVPSTKTETYCDMQDRCTMVKMPCKVKVVKPQCTMKCFSEPCKTATKSASSEEVEFFKKDSFESFASSEKSTNIFQNLI